MSSDDPQNTSQLLNGLEIAKHNTRDSCWVVISSYAYDVTEFLEEHPGGAAVILKYGGKDATIEYEPIHPKGTIDKSLAKDKHLGPVNMATISSPAKPQVTRDLEKTAPVPLSHIMNLDDMELAAEKIISRSAWTYFHSAADSLGSYENNRNDWKKVTFRPRIMRNVASVSMERKMFGRKCRLPFFIAPAARAALVHDDGEKCLARGAANCGIGYCASSYSSIEHEELAKEFERVEVQGGDDGYGALWFQLYVAKKRERTIELIEMAKRLGFKALVITVDTAVVGKREEDERYRAELSTAAGNEEQLLEWKNPGQLQGEDAPVLRGHHSSTLNWEDLGWIKKAWGWPESGPIALKGIQTVEDAFMAAAYGVDAIYLSNHGGRQCDDAPSSIRTLLEIRKFHPEILRKVEVYLDGGVRRGADVLKALCLGATGVALGRPFMYSVAYGDQGVEKVISILSEEIETTMRLFGVTSLDQLGPAYVNTKRLEMELPDEIDISSDHPRIRSKL